MIKNLDDIAWFQEGPGVRNYQYTTNGTKLINVSNLGGINLNLSNTSRYISNEEANGKYRHFLCDVGDLVIASSGINETSISEKVSIVKKDDLPLCMNTSVIRFKPLNNDEVSVKYLYYFFKSDSYKKQIMKLMTGIAQLNYGPSHLHKIKINYVEKAQQEQITNQLDLLSSLVETLKKQLTLFDELIKSRFIEMFMIDDKDKYPLMKWKDVVTIKHGKDYKKNIVETGGYPVYGSGGFMGVYADNFLVNENSIIIGRKGTIDKPIFVKEKYWNVDTAFGIEVNKAYLNPIFFYVRSSLYDLKALSTSTTLPSMTQSTLLNIEIGIPPIKLQNEFASFVEQIDKSKFVVHSRYFLCDILTLFSSTIA